MGKENLNFELHENDIKILKQLDIDLFLTTKEIQQILFPDLSIKLVENGVWHLHKAGYIGRVKRFKKFSYFLDDKGEEFLNSC